MDQYSMDPNADTNAKQVISTTTYNGWSNYATANKTTIILMMIVAAIAIWYFYFRKDSMTLTSDTNMGMGQSKVNIVRMRGSGAY